jgi:hypothetical protein
MAAPVSPSVDDEVVQMICRQTSYTPEEALEQLIELKDPMKVVQGYMVPREIKKPVRNTHQMIYHEIGKFVEESAQQPLKKK